MSDRSLVGPIVLGLALTGATGVCLYLLLKGEDYGDLGGEGVTSRQVTLDVKIPKEHVGIVIGRQGANIREIQAKTETRLNFKDELETEDYRVVSIRGMPDSAQMAEILIHQTIAQQPRVETVVMMVPTRTVGKIIGRGGDTVRSISRATRCKVDVERETKRYETRIELRGSSDSIESAKKLIQEKVWEAELRNAREGKVFDMLEGKPGVDEEELVRAHVGNRQPRLKSKQPLFLSYETPEEECAPSLVAIQEELRPTAGDNCIEVFVSAVSSPGSFWVQKIGPHSVDLDKLTQEMTHYYGIQTNQSFHKLDVPKEGDVVIAQFSGDHSYYRARVVAFHEDSYDVTKSTVDLNFVDFGDCEEKCVSEVFDIKTEFLRLKFQAIECRLAHIRPVEGCEWSDEAISQFEAMSHCALWKVLYAKMVDSGGNKEGLPPSIELIDTSFQGAERNLGEELVNMGLASTISSQ